MSAQAATALPPILSRESLARDDFLDRIAASNPGMEILTQAELDQSLRDALAERPSRYSGIYLFGYGSLLWNNPLDASHSHRVTVHGWRRAFCLKNIYGRGSVERPGLTLGLEAGGNCQGLAFHVSEDRIEHELRILWRREMLLGTYVAQWVDATDADGKSVGPMLTFVADPKNPRYMGDLSTYEVAECLSEASGSLGTSADYLVQTQAELQRVGFTDAYIDDLIVRVTRLLQK